MVEKIFFFPDYSGGNPYQKLLYRSVVKEGVLVNSSNIFDVLRIENLSGVLFHMHWLNAVFVKCKDDEAAWDILNEWITAFTLFKSRGGLLMWTIHNHLPHEKKFAEQDLRLRHFLSANADRIHLHCGSHVSELSYLPIDPNIISIQRHGSYIGYYGYFDLNSRLSSFNIAKPRALFLGMIRGYKNIDALIKVLKNLAKSGVSVTVAGQPESQEIADKLLNCLHGYDVQFVLRRVSESEVHSLCSSHDIGILSYDKILTSGTLKLYLSYAMQIIAPSLNTLIIEDRFDSFFFYHDDSLDYELKSASEYHDIFKKSYYLALESSWSSFVFEKFYK